jgi:peptide deformylase
MIKRPLAYYGDAVLRQKSVPVEKITQEIHQLVADLIETMYANHGCGISAVQVHLPVRVCIVCPDVIDDDGNYVEGSPKVFINPKLINPDKELVAREEGCLSIPRTYGAVLRPKAITVEYTNLAGEKVTERFEGLPARIAMHENDHLNGVLFIDRMSDKDRRKLEPQLRDIKKRRQSGELV